MAKKISNATANRLEWNVNTLINMIDDDEIDFDASIQRGLVWDNLRNSKLIQTILLEWPTGVLYLNKTKSGYDCLDGKQRSHALYNFVKNGYKLHKNTPPIADKKGNLIEIAKQRYDDLPEDCRNIIMRYGLLAYSFEDMGIEDKIDFFTRINLGKPVTAADISRIKVKSRKVFQTLAKHEAMQLGVREKAKTKFADEDILKNIWVMCYNENKSLLDKDTSPLFETIEVSKEQEKDLATILDYMEIFLQKTKDSKEIFNKIRAKAHLSSLGYMAFLAAQKGIDEDDYFDKALKFFSTDNRKPTISEEYNATVAAGGAKPEKVNIRIAELEKAME